MFLYPPYEIREEGAPYFWPEPRWLQSQLRCSPQSRAGKERSYVVLLVVSRECGI